VLALFERMIDLLALAAQVDVSPNARDETTTSLMAHKAVLAAAADSPPDRARPRVRAVRAVAPSASPVPARRARPAPTAARSAGGPSSATSESPGIPALPTVPTAPRPSACARLRAPQLGHGPRFLHDLATSRPRRQSAQYARLESTTSQRAPSRKARSSPPSITAPSASATARGSRGGTPRAAPRAA
jgi:hypothetical protein